MRAATDPAAVCREGRRRRPRKVRYHPGTIKDVDDMTLMAVDRRVLVQRIFDVQPDILPFLQPNEGGGQHAVEGDGMAGAASDRERTLRHPEADILAGKGRERRQQAWRSGLRPGGKQVRKAKAGGAERGRTQKARRGSASVLDMDVPCNAMRSVASGWRR